jgi:hypothetical protein
MVTRGEKQKAEGKREERREKTEVRRQKSEGRRQKLVAARFDVILADVNDEPRNTRSRKRKSHDVMSFDLELFTSIRVISFSFRSCISCFVAFRLEREVPAKAQRRKGVELHSIFAPLREPVLLVLCETAPPRVGRFS